MGRRHPRSGRRRGHERGGTTRMKLGLLTAPFPETPLDEVVAWTAANGFESIEIACWPRSSGPTRRYAGTSHIDVANLSAGQATEIAGEIASKGLTISGLGYYPNPLHPDPEHRAQVIGHLKQVILAAEKMDVSLVNTFMGADGSKHQDDNWEEALRVWPTSSRCDRPGQDHDRELPDAVQLRRGPVAITRDHAAHLAPDPGALGRRSGQFDLSHLILQMIDIPRFIREFGPHILHVQAKDLLIDREGLYERGVFSLGMGWQVPRLPGLGDVAWGPLFAALYRAGYDGDVIIEHEDRDFEKTDQLVKRGFLLARDILRPYIK
jgi:sugar phosphate isomerase/epimerase